MIGNLTSPLTVTLSPLTMIDKLRRMGFYREGALDAINRLMSSHTFRSTGIVGGDEEELELLGDLTADDADKWLEPECIQEPGAGSAAELQGAQRDIEHCDESGKHCSALNPFAYPHSFDERQCNTYLHVYTDGGIIDASTDWLAKGAWACFVEDGHPHNCAGILHGLWPTSARRGDGGLTSAKAFSCPHTPCGRQ